MTEMGSQGIDSRTIHVIQSAEFSFELFYIVFNSYIC